MRSAIEQHPAFIGTAKARQYIQQRRLSATAWTEQRDEFAGRNLKRYVSHGGDIFAGALEEHADAVEGEARSPWNDGKMVTSSTCVQRNSSSSGVEMFTLGLICIRQIGSSHSDI
jgi:hypothetical protein